MIVEQQNEPVVESDVEKDQSEGELIVEQQIEPVIESDVEKEQSEIIIEQNESVHIEQDQN